MKTALQGRYRLLIHTGETVRYTSPWFDNLITDAGMDRIAQDFWFTTCFVGTGTTTPTYADTQLDQYEAETEVTELPLASSSSSSSSSGESVFSGALDVPPYYGFIRVHFYFPIGAFQRIRISEVGVGWLTDSGSGSSSSSSASYCLFSRALVENSLGEPQSLKIYEFEQLEVQYELRLYPRLEDFVYNQELAGSLSTCVARAAEAGDPSCWALNRLPVDLTTHLRVYDGLGSSSSSSSSSDDEPANDALGPVTGLPQGDWVEGTVLETMPYVPGTHYQDFLVEWSANRANFEEGIRAVSFQTYGFGSFQVGIDPPLFKAYPSYLMLQLRIMWDRLEDSSSSSSSSS